MILVVFVGPLVLKCVDLRSEHDTVADGFVEFGSHAAVGIDGGSLV